MRKNEDQVSKILNDPEAVRRIIQSGIDKALLRHKQAGNSVCSWENGKVVWIQSKDIPVKR